MIASDELAPKAVMRVLFIALLLTLPGASAGGAAATVEVGVDGYSEYLWRGFLLCDEPVVQPSVTISSGDWSLNCWTNFDAGSGGRCTEVDYTLSRSFALHGSAATAGYSYYTFSDLEEGGSSHEVFLGIVGQGKMPVSLTAYYDFAEGDGLYAELATEAPVPLGGREATLELALGYNRHQWREETGLTHLQVSLSCPIALRKVTVSPMVAHSLPLADDLNSHTIFGVSAQLPLE